MYMNPTIPIVTPVLQPLVETFVKENVIAKDAVRLILMIVIVTAISATVGFLLHKRMKKHGFVQIKPSLCFFLRLWQSLCPSGSG